MPYFAPGNPDFNYLRHMVLVGGNMTHEWRKEDFMHYVTHLSSNGQPDDWMFDTFTLWHFKSPRGGFLYSDINIGSSMNGEGDFYAVPAPDPGTRDDWEAVLNWYFEEGIFIQALDSAIEEAVQLLDGPPEYKRNLVVTIPYPGPLQTQFGKIDGKKLNFSIAGQNLDKATRDRLRACQWFIDEVSARFAAGNYKHLNLLGFYWTFESVHKSWDVDDHWLLKELHKYVREKNQCLFWIPFYSSYNVHLLDDYQKYYFDGAFLQPNYMFYRDIQDVNEAADAARDRGAGIEMEFYTTLDEPIGVQKERLQRFDRYLAGGIEFGYMTESACAWFDGGKAIYQLYYHEDPRERAYYDKIYQFIRGTYSLTE